MRQGMKTPMESMIELICFHRKCMLVLEGQIRAQ